jgi:8-oxo-dGTP diphosphatase
MDRMSKGKYVYPYPRPMVAVDIVVVTRDRPAKLLLIRRKNEPYAGCWALPGGYLEMDETLEAAAHRELGEETGVKVAKLVPLGPYDAVDRDPRGRTITFAYLARVWAKQIKPKAADDAAEVGWFPLSRLPQLAFDHRDILAVARKRMK